MKKLKKLNLYRPEFEIGTNRPVLGRLILFASLPFLCKVFRQDVCINLVRKFGHLDCGTVTIKKMWFICIPKIKVVDCVE